MPYGTIREASLPRVGRYRKEYASPGSIPIGPRPVPCLERMVCGACLLERSVTQPLPYRRALGMWTVTGRRVDDRPPHHRRRCYNNSLARLASGLRSPFSKVMCAKSGSPLALSIK